MVYKNSPGNITDVSEAAVEVTLFTKDSFSSCKEKGCNLCSAPTKVQKITVSVPVNEQFEIGQFVILSIPSINEALAAFCAFLLPLIVTLAAYFFVTFVLNWPAESGKSIIVLIVSFFCSLFTPVIVDRHMKQKYPIEISKSGNC